MENKINVEDVVSVYSGKLGCACGCRGKHTYAESQRNTPEAQYGAVNDRVVARLTNFVAKDERARRDDDIVSFETETRLYIVYLREGAVTHGIPDENPETTPTEAPAEVLAAEGN